MKKKYITPACIVMKMELENTLLSTSQGSAPGVGDIGQTPVEVPEGNPGEYWEVE